MEQITAEVIDIIGAIRRPSPAPETAMSLKTTLRRALKEFDAALKKLSPAEREAAEVLYLKKIRMASFTLHLAVHTVAAKRKAKAAPTQEDLKQVFFDRSAEATEIAKLYRLL